MHIDLMRDRAKTLPVFDRPQELRSLCIWHCRYKSLSGIGILDHLRTLVIASYPDKDLEILKPLINLEYLSILHFPHVTDLSPLTALQNLHTLALATLPSWDPSGRVISVESLEPISTLPRLRYLQLFGVRPKDKSLLPLHNVNSLLTARFTKFPKTEIDNFYSQTNVSNKFVPEPNFTEDL
jgi:hypothetical protein